MSSETKFIAKYSDATGATKYVYAASICDEPNGQSVLAWTEYRDGAARFNAAAKSRLHKGFPDISFEFIEA